MKGLEDIIDISSGWQHSLAIKSDGTIWTWGDNRFGQLGDRTFRDRKIPVQVKNFNVNTTNISLYKNKKRRKGIGVEER